MVVLCFCTLSFPVRITLHVVCSVLRKILYLSPLLLFTLALCVVLSADGEGLILFPDSDSTSLAVILIVADFVWFLPIFCPLPVFRTSLCVCPSMCVYVYISFVINAHVPLSSSKSALFITLACLILFLFFNSLLVSMCLGFLALRVVLFVALASDDDDDDLDDRRHLPGKSIK